MKRKTPEYIEHCIEVLTEILSELESKNEYPRKVEVCRLMNRRGIPVNHTHFSGARAWAKPLARMTDYAQSKARLAGQKIHSGRYGNAAVEAVESGEITPPTPIEVVYVFRRGDSWFRVKTADDNWWYRCYCYPSLFAKFKVEKRPIKGGVWQHHSWLSAQGLETIKAKVAA